MILGIGIKDVIDILFMSFLIYTILVWFKHTRSAFVLTGIGFFGIVYLIARQFNMLLTAYILQGFFAIFLLALVIIFQEEIRRFLEQIAIWGVVRHKKRRTSGISREEVEAIVRALLDMAREKVGALIVIRGKNMLEGHLAGGVELGGKLSDAILKTIFNPGSAGHDGAVVIEGHRIIKFATYLPLSKNFKKLSHRGTRHAAALGLAELTDSLCLVASEEKGTISAANNGDIKSIPNGDALAKLITNFYRKMYPKINKQPLKTFFLKNYREKLTALAATTLLWFVLVFGSETVYKTITLPIQFTELPPNISITSVIPQQVDITISGQRKSLYFLNDKNIKMHLKTLHLKKGVHTLRLSSSDITLPKSASLEILKPDRIKIEVKSTETKQDKNTTNHMQTKNNS